MMGISVNKHQIDSNYGHEAWQKLIKDFSLSQECIEQFKKYLFFLIEWNEKFNLTAILDPERIINEHFYDSLKIAHTIDFNTVSSIADVGTGAGFPGMALKIMFPHLKVTLIEVNSKKRIFLDHLAQTFGLQDVLIVGDDWRSFLRSYDHDIEYFFARASLQPEELVRIFKPSSAYKNSTFVYWASSKWVPGKQEAMFVKNAVDYKLGDVVRKYVFFKS